MSGVSIEKVVGAGVRIEVSLTSRVNLAFHQNAVPFLRELVVVNDSDSTFTEVELELSSEPGFLKSRMWRLDCVGANQRYHVSGLDVNLEAGLLALLTEAEAASATFILKAGGEEIARLVHPQRQRVARPRQGDGGFTNRPSG